MSEPKTTAADLARVATPRRTPQETQERVARSLRRRYWAERRFQFYGMAAVFLGIVFVVFLFASIFVKGASTFRQSYIQVDVFYDPAIIDPAGTRKPQDIADADYQGLIRAGLKERFPQVEGRKDTRDLSRLISSGASFDLRRRVMNSGDLIGQRGDAVAARERRRRHAHERAHRRVRRRWQVQREPAALDRRAQEGRCAGTAFQQDVLHPRRFARAGAGGRVGVP